MKITPPQHDLSHYRQIALGRIRRLFPEAGPSCFSGRYVMEEQSGGPVFADREAAREYPGSRHAQTLHVSEEEFAGLLVKDGLKALLNCEIRSGAWCFSLPEKEPGSGGRRIAARMAAVSMDRFYEWGVDADGFPYERYERPDGPAGSDNSYLKRISFDELARQLALAGLKLKGSGHEQEFSRACAEFVSTAEKKASRKLTPGRFVIYDLFSEGTAQRVITDKNGSETRLEKYGFVRNADGTVGFTAQEGWFAGSHYDGCGNTFELPQEWFALSWDGFLDRFTEKYPETSFGYGRSELAAFPGLREFLGFGPDRRGGVGAGAFPEKAPDMPGKPAAGKSSAPAGSALRCGDDASAAEHRRAQGEKAHSGKAAARKMEGNRLRIGRWLYSAPSLEPNAGGCLVVTQMSSDSPCEYYEWGIDGQGEPYEKHEHHGGDGLRSAENYCKKLSPEQFRLQLRQLKTAVRGSEAEHWAEAYAEFEKLASGSPGRVKKDVRPQLADISSLRRTWFCTECGTRHEGGRYCMECGTLRYELREAENNAAPCRPEAPKEHIVLERDSVSMGDDCNAPHTSPLEYDRGCMLSEFMPSVASYLPPMRYMGWLLCCDAERIAMLYSGGDAGYSWELLAKDRKLDTLPLKELFCIKCAELVFEEGEEKPGERGCIERLIKEIRTSEFF